MGGIFRDRENSIVNTVVLDIVVDQISTIRAVRNPYKLDHLGPVADAWTILREANQARRSSDRSTGPTG